MVVLQGVSVHQVAVSRGLPDIEMSFTPRGPDGKRQHSIEEDVEIANYLEPGDVEPMYSSFSCDNVFREPVYLQPAAYAPPLDVFATIINSSFSPHRHVRRKPTRLFQTREEIIRTTPSTYENVPLHVVRQLCTPLQTMSLTQRPLLLLLPLLLQTADCLNPYSAIVPEANVRKSCSAGASMMKRLAASNGISCRDNGMPRHLINSCSVGAIRSGGFQKCPDPKTTKVRRSVSKLCSCTDNIGRRRDLRRRGC